MNLLTSNPEQHAEEKLREGGKTHLCKWPSLAPRTHPHHPQDSWQKLWVLLQDEKFVVALN